MRHHIWAGLVAASSLALAVNCSGDDDGSGDDGSDGTTGGSGGSSSGGSSSGGSSGGGSSSGGSAGTGVGGSAGGSSTGDPVACPADIMNVSTALAEAICDKRTECCEGDQDDCVTEVVAAIDASYPDLGESDDADTASLNCGAFDACALAIHEASCDEWPLQAGELGGLPVDEPECLAIITPKIADGDECTYNYECIDGLCRVPEDEAQGECSEFSNLNASCEDGLECDPATMFCNDAHVCQARLPNGATCTANGQCESRICDVEASGECLAPGPDQCEYVPNGAAHCALGGAPGSGKAPCGLFVTALAGLGVSLARRRPRGISMRLSHGCHSLRVTARSE
jgi:hypothetical protein